MTFQNLTSEQIKALLEKHPYVSKETLVEHQNIDEDLARYILDTQEFDADVYMALYKHNTFSRILNRANTEIWRFQNRGQ